MAARSFPLDLFQLNFGDFKVAYKWGSLSETEYLKMRADCAKAPHETILASATISGSAVIALSGVVITGLRFYVTGTNISGYASFTNTNYSIIPFSTVSGSYPASFEVRNIELPSSTGLAFVIVSGTAEVSYTIFGYTPPSIIP